MLFPKRNSLNMTARERILFGVGRLSAFYGIRSALRIQPTCSALYNR